MSTPNVRCPVCQENGHDNGTDKGHLFLMEKGDRWCCNRVEHHLDGMYVFYPNNKEDNTPILNNDSTEDVSQKHSEDTSEAPDSPFESVGTNTFPDNKSFSKGTFSSTQRKVIDFRGVPARVWEEYGVDFEIIGDEPVKQFYPVTLNGKHKTYKVRLIEDKEFFWEHGKRARKKDLFGMSTLGGKIPKTLLITEGEVDAVSAKFMLEKYKVKVVSGMDGDSIKNISYNVEFLEKVPNLVFCPDNDAAGNEYCEKIVSLIPNIKVMQIQLKDANQMLTEGKEAQFIDAFYRADSYRPPSIVEVSTIKESLRESVPVGISYAWNSLDAITYGMNPHTVLSIGSGPGAGKTTLVRGIQEHLMFHHDLPVGIFSLEEAKELTLRQLVGYQMNQRIHLPGSTYDIDEAMHHAERLEGRAFIYDRRFFNGRWEKIEKSIRFMYANGIRHFFIDPITALVVHLDSSAQNTALGKIMSDLSALMQELPIYVMLVNHLNNPTSGPTHDEGGRVLPSQFTGSKSQWRFSTDMWGVERNSLSEDDEDKNTVLIRNLKHRTDGDLMGRYINLKYDKTSGRLVEGTSGFKSVNSSLTKDTNKDNKQEENVSEKHQAVSVGSTTTLNDVFGGN